MVVYQPAPGSHDEGDPILLEDQELTRVFNCKYTVNKTSKQRRSCLAAGRCTASKRQLENNDMQDTVIGTEGERINLSYIFIRCNLIIQSRVHRETGIEDTHWKLTAILSKVGKTTVN